MTITREQVGEALRQYLASHPGDASRLARLTTALAGEADVLARTEMSGHVTAATVLVRTDGDVLHIRHRALGRWLIPGGHLEPGDTSLPAAALRELAEETGLVARPGDVELIDIDVHPIPASLRTAEAAHQHFDFRFLARAGSAGVTLQLDEVTACRWMPVQEATHPVLARRLRDIAR